MDLEGNDLDLIDKIFWNLPGETEGHHKAHQSGWSVTRTGISTSHFWKENVECHCCKKPFVLYRKHHDSNTELFRDVTRHSSVVFYRRFGTLMPR
jgi:hypothetical protein